MSLYFEAYKSNPKFLAMQLGTACLAEIEGEVGRVIHNHTWRPIRALIADRFCEEMFNEIAGIIVKYAVATEAERKQTDARPD